MPRLPTFWRRQTVNDAIRRAPGTHSLLQPLGQAAKKTRPLVLGAFLVEVTFHNAPKYPLCVGSKLSCGREAKVNAVHYVFGEICELSEQPNDARDQEVRGRLQDHRRRRPLPEGAIKTPGVEDEGDAAVEELPTHSGAVGVSKVKVQHTGRNVGVTGQIERRVQSGSGKHRRAGILEAARDVDAN